MDLVLRCALSFMLVQAVPTLQFRGPTSKHATITSGPAPISAAAGEKVSLFVDMSPNKGVHVYAPGAKDYLPVKVTLKPTADVKVGKLAYPKSEMVFFAPLKETVPVFAKPFRMTQDVTLAKTVKPGATVSLEGTLEFQACDDNVCYVPESVPVTWTVTVK